MPFRRWLRCPECGGDDTGMLAYQIAIVLECYDCSTVEEFKLGEEVSVHELDVAEIESSSADDD